MFCIADDDDDDGAYYYKEDEKTVSFPMINDSLSFSSN